MNQSEIDNFANLLTESRLNSNPIDQISSKVSNFLRSDAYLIQEHGINIRKSHGEKVIGIKMGLTSEAKRQQMGLDSPLYGFLTDKMKVEKSFSLKGTIHPKIEPEIAFFIKDKLRYPVTKEQVLNACSHVYPCMEILDSRYKQFKYFSMEDVISDNSSSAFFVLGERFENFFNINLNNLSMKMFVNGELAREGNSSAISGDPVNSVIELCKLLSERDKFIEEGTIVLAGAATPAIDLKEDMIISLKVDNMKDIELKVEK